jgi:ferrous iron transport protein B
LVEHIALIGNPNSGKSTIFNLLTGIQQKTGNYPGVTVDKKEGWIRLIDGKKVRVTDLPGTYSLNAKTEDERVVTNFIENPDRTNFPDLFVVVADASNLERNLLLFTQLYDQRLPVLLVLNMIDLAQKKGSTIDTEKLSALLGGVPIVSFNAKKNRPEKLKEAIASFQNPTIWQPFYSNGSAPALDENHLLNETEVRYQKIKKLLAFLNKDVTNNDSYSQKIDALVTHKIWGYVIFAGILFFIF